MTSASEAQDRPRPDARNVRENLILIGYRGCGKSTVGRLVARRLGWRFIDTDELIEKASGRSIASIFTADGEPAFRELERWAIEQAVEGSRRVIAVGGGAVLSEANRHRLGAAGLCIWLTAPPEELHSRLQSDPRSPSQRPPLTDLGGLEEVRRLLAARAPLYRAVADRIIDTAGLSVEELVQEVSAVVPGKSTSAGGS